MIYGLFHKDKFVRIQLNYDTGDKNFVRNIAKSLGLEGSEKDLKLVAYRAAIRNDDSITFDEQFRLLKSQITEVPVRDEDGTERVINQLKVVESIDGEVVFPES